MTGRKRQSARHAAAAGMRALAAGLWLAALAAAPAAAQDAAGDFDFYVLALSWSPSYCAAEGTQANRQQCGARPAHGFVVHGLWPQHARGYPEYCASRAPDRVPEPLVRRYLDLMPSAGLIGHQWRKHGTCTGLSQEAYLATVRQARERVRLPEHLAAADDARLVDPDAVEAAFRDANPGLPAAAIAVTCEGRLLREVRVCLGRDLSFRACPEIDRRACRRDRALMPPRD